MNTKLIVALVGIGILAIALVGFVAAQAATTPPNGTVSGGASNTGFFGWMGRCFGFRNNQYYGTSSSTYQGLPANITVTNPYTNQTTTYQGYVPYQGLPTNVTVTNPYTGQTTSYPYQSNVGFGYGPCMRGWVP